MAAWKHFQFWTDRLYEVEYRKFVMDNAAHFEGRTEDCADISMLLLIEFAAAKGLPLTFYDNAGVRYISKAERQSPRNTLLQHRSLTWKNKDKYTEAVKDRIGAQSLFRQNMEPNRHGPEPGDLMIKQGDPHAALVFRVLPPGKGHPLANQLGVAPSGIPLFPGPAQAAKELNQTKYFRSCWSTMTMAASPVLHWSGRPGQGWGLRHIFATKWEFYIGPHSSLVTR